MGSAEVVQGSTDAPDLESIKVPGWYFWSSDAGSPYATRTPAVLTPEQERAGCEMTIAGDNTEDLLAKIAAQPDSQAAAVDANVGA
jgi:hypothetical protein